jgi:hypothetical protein
MHLHKTLIFIVLYTTQYKNISSAFTRDDLVGLTGYGLGVKRENEYTP